ncbi:MAG TPA: TetR family transcriptional regulator [Streptomyces sp.]
MCPRATAAQPGLRERKKVQTRKAIRKAAYRLFADDGYDATTVDRIAAEADVSPSTVFRYFPTKEDIVLTDEYDDGMLDALRNRPAGEPPLDALRAVMRETLAVVLADPAERAELVQRQILMRDVPAIRSRSQESMIATGRQLGAVIADRTGRPAGDQEVRVFTAAVFGALHETIMYWTDTGLGNDDLLPLMDRAFDVLAGGLRL